MSAEFYKKVSTLVRNQLPDFVKDNNETFVAFLRAYYEYLEQNEEASNIIQNAKDYADVDKTIDSFIQYFLQEFAYGIPEYVFKIKLSGSDVDNNAKRFLVKYIKGLYRSKGSPNALRFLFRLAFDEEIEIYYPNDFLLRPSDGKFNRYAVVRVRKDESANLANIINKEIKGEQSSLITSFDSVLVLGDDFYDLYLNEDDFLDNEIQFMAGERIIPVDPTINLDGDVFVVPVLTEVAVNKKGIGYFSTDTITILPNGAAGYFKGSERNIIWNPTIKGVSVSANTLPLDWKFSGGGLRYRIENFGSTEGLDYIDLRVFGTRTTKEANIIFNNNHPIEASVNSYALSGFVTIQSGNISGFDNSNLYLNIKELDSSNNVLYSSNIFFNPTNETGESFLSQKRTLVKNITDANVKYIVPSLIGTGNISSNSNVVLRIAGIQLEIGSNASPQWYDPDLYFKDTNVPPAPQATIAALSDTGEILDVFVNQRGANLTSNTSVVLTTQTGNLSARYTFVNNIATFTTLSSNIFIAADHGLTRYDEVDITVDTGNLIAGKYLVTDPISLKSFQAILNEGNVGYLRNEVRWSEQLNNSYWTKLGANVIANSTIAPDGTLTGDKLTANATTGLHYFTNATDLKLFGGDTISVYGKKEEFDRFGIYNLSSNVGAMYNLQWGFVESLSNVITKSTIEENDDFVVSITPDGDWYRCRLTLKTGSSYTGQYYIGLNKNEYASSFTGDNTGLYLWGVQVNRHSFTTRYLKTEGSSGYVNNSDENNFYFTESLNLDNGEIQERWTRTNLANVFANVTANADPSGTFNAFKMIESDVSGAHYLSQSRPLQGNTEYTISVFAKAAERGNIRLAGNGNGMFSVYSYADFNLANGTLLRTSGNITSANIVHVTDGWYRIHATGKKFPTGTAEIQIKIKDDSSVGNVYTGDASNTYGLYIWHPQLNVGSEPDNYVDNSSNISIAYSRVNYAGNAVVKYNKPANLTPVIGTVSRGAFGYALTAQEGQLSSSMRIQDSHKWQKYSYVIKTALSIDLWKDLIKTVLHPAGLILFNETVIYTVVEGEQVALKVSPDTKPYDAFITLLMILSETPFKTVAMKAPREYYEYLIHNHPELIDEWQSVYSIGSTVRTIQTFRFGYGYEFPINIVGGYTFEDWLKPNILNTKSSFQPPSYREYPAREEANANLIYTIHTSTNANAAIVYGTHVPTNK